MSTPQGLRTPPRTTFNMFDEEDEPVNNNPFTPCTRLSRMTIESQSNGQNRTRTGHFQLPVTNFTEKLMSVVREEEQASSSHPNLDMFLTADRISMSKDNQMFSFSEDEDSDEGDLFSSSLCPMSSPERIYTKTSIFDDEPMHSFFDNEEEEEEEEANDNDHYDPTDSWLSQIYYDNNDTLINNKISSNQQDQEEEENENRPPRFYFNNKSEKKVKRTLPLEEDNSAHERLPLREIRFEDYLSDDELHTKKKFLLPNGKSQKMRYMRTLSPPRYAKRKGKEPAENILPLSTVM